jgi:hypothetical protein
MKEFLTDLSKKYGIPYEKTSDLVLEVVDRIEKDLPASVAAKINSELGGTLKDATAKKLNVFKIP